MIECVKNIEDMDYPSSKKFLLLKKNFVYYDRGVKISIKKENKESVFYMFWAFDINVRPCLRVVVYKEEIINSKEFSQLVLDTDKKIFEESSENYFGVFVLFSYINETSIRNMFFTEWGPYEENCSHGFTLANYIFTINFSLFIEYCNCSFRK